MASDLEQLRMWIDRGIRLNEDEERELLAAAEEVVGALRDAIPILERLDTLRHLTPDYPELDRARAALARWDGAKGGKP